MVPESRFPLSVAARARMAAVLPGLLVEVRGRRRRRAVRRAAATALVLACGAWAGVWLARREPAAAPLRHDVATPGAAAAAPRYTVVRDDPSVLARCEVRTAVRDAWFVDDAGLHDLLRDAARPAGLVRAGDRVFVDAAAIDEWSTGPGDDAP